MPCASAGTPRAGLKDRNTKMAERTNETLAQRRINILASRISAMVETMKETRELAFKLAMDGNSSGVFQLRGAFSGTLAAAETTDGFLSGLVGLIDR